jgi:hypothetical protein
MVLGLAAVSAALELVSSIQSSATGKTSSASATARQTFPVPNFTSASSSSAESAVGSSNGTIAPDTMRALLSMQGQTAPTTQRKNPLEELFTALDGDGDGKVSKSEFESALGQDGNLDLADDVFTKMDKDGDGSLTLGEMTSALRGRKHGPPPGEGMAEALKGASTRTTTNADGSTTTTITYGDGSTVSMTQSASAASSYNAVERMIARQAEMISSSSGAGSSVTVSA